MNPLYVEYKNGLDSVDPSLDVQLSSSGLDEQSRPNKIHPKVLNVDVSPQCIKFWRTLYNRFEFGIHPRDSLDEIMVATKSHIITLEEHIQFVESVS
jgi:hypothetical protein